MPSTMSLDSLKGTVSGVGSVLPCSNATPGSAKKKARQDAGSVSVRCDTFKSRTQVDVHQLSAALVDQNVLDVSVAQTHHVAN